MNPFIAALSDDHLLEYYTKMKEMLEKGKQSKKIQNNARFEIAEVENILRQRNLIK